MSMMHEYIYEMYSGDTFTKRDYFISDQIHTKHQNNGCFLMNEYFIMVDSKYFWVIMYSERKLKFSWYYFHEDFQMFAIIKSA